SCAQRRVLPSMSVKRKVTVPLGSSATLAPPRPRWGGGYRTIRCPGGGFLPARTPSPSAAGERRARPQCDESHPAGMNTVTGRERVRSYTPSITGSVHRMRWTTLRRRQDMMTSRSAWLVLFVVAVALWIGYLAHSLLSGTEGLRQALAPNQSSVSADRYLEQRLGEGARR